MSTVLEQEESDELCVKCYSRGILRSVVMGIPHFQTVGVTSFLCDSCGFSKRTVQSFTDYKPQGVIITLEATSPEDLNRLLVRSEFCKITFSDIQLQLPPEKERTLLTTCEGLIMGFVDDLNIMQPQRRIQTPEIADKIEEVLEYFAEVGKTGKFILEMDDPSGNSYVEMLDGGVHVEKYTRSEEQDRVLGLQQFYETKEKEEEDDFVENVLPDICAYCRAECDMKFQEISVPHFSSVIIMTTKCWRCGHKNCQVKSAEPYQSYGVRCELLITSSSDLMRDVILTESTKVSIPHMEFNSTAGVGVDSTYTTVEGLMMGLRDMVATASVFSSGDSAPPDYKERREYIIGVFDKICTGEFECTLILDDLTGNLMVQSADGKLEGESDDNLTITKYERSWDQNKELGLCYDE